MVALLRHHNNVEAYRVPLWMSGLVLVLSSLVMLGLSTLSTIRKQQHDDDTRGFQYDRSPTSSSYKNGLSKWDRLDLIDYMSSAIQLFSMNNLHDRDHPRNDMSKLSFGDTSDVVDEATSDKNDDIDIPSQRRDVFSWSEVQDDQQFHRRLTRLVRPSRERERELKLQKAQERRNRKQLRSCRK